MALTAVMVGMSGTNAKLTRVLPVVGFIFMLQIISGVLFRGGFNNFMSFCTLSDWESRVGILSYLCFITYLGWCALSHGISIIAPAAENHSTLRRLIALGLTCVAVAVGFHPLVDAHVPLLIFGIILAPAVITALTEPSNLLPPIYTPFLKRGLPGRLAAAFLLPGWPAGVFYSILLLAVSTAGFLATARPAISPSEMTEIAIYILAVVGGILLPALLAANFSKQESKRFTNFLVFLLASVILTIIPAIFANINNHENYLWLFIWNPPIFITMADESSFDKNQLLTAVMIVDFIILALLLATAAIAFRGYREIIKEAESGLAVPAP
jgi:hypothetical protein